MRCLHTSGKGLYTLSRKFECTRRICSILASSSSFKSSRILYVRARRYSISIYSEGRIDRMTNPANVQMAVKHAKNDSQHSEQTPPLRTGLSQHLIGLWTSHLMNNNFGHVAVVWPISRHCYFCGTLFLKHDRKNKTVNIRTCSTCNWWQGWTV